MVKKRKMTLDKLGTKVDTLASALKTQGENLDSLARFTANGFTEVNKRFDKMDKKIDGVKTELKADINEVHNDIFRQNRILIAEVERNDRQDTQIKQLETKVLK